MKNYDPNIYMGIHTLRITIMNFDFVGHIEKEVGGNCRGKSMIESGLDIFEEFEGETKFMRSDCELTALPNEMLRAVLTNEKGEQLIITEHYSEFEDMIVGVEIIDYKDRK